MDVDRFWAIVDAARKTAAGDANAEVVELRRAIESLSPDEVARFVGHCDSYMARAYGWDLWAAAYILMRGCSDGGFAVFRDRLMLQGRDVFERAVVNPDSLSELTIDDPESDFRGAGPLAIALDVYRAKTGRDAPPSSTPDQTAPDGDEWEEESTVDLKRICPELWGKYGWDDT